MGKKLLTFGAAILVGAVLGLLSTRYVPSGGNGGDNLGAADVGTATTTFASLGNSTAGQVLLYEYPTASNEPYASTTQPILNMTGGDALWFEMGIVPDGRHSTPTVKFLVETSANGTDWFYWQNPSATSTNSYASTTVFASKQGVVILDVQTPSNTATGTVAFPLNGFRGARNVRLRFSAPLIGPTTAAERTEPIRMFGSVSKVTER